MLRCLNCIGMSGTETRGKVLKKTTFANNKSAVQIKKKRLKTSREDWCYLPFLTQWVFEGRSVGFK